jgi:hypothetical protein
MGRLTLRLPESLHRQLESRARQEKVSLNQYLVYALTRHVALSYMVTPVPEEAVQQQRKAFEGLLEDLRHASSVETGQALAERAEVPYETELDPEVVARLRQRISEVSSSE